MVMLCCCGNSDKCHNATLVNSITAITIIFSFFLSSTADRLVNVENVAIFNDCFCHREDDQLPDYHYHWFLDKRGATDVSSY